MEQQTIRLLLVEDNPADVLFLREALEQDTLAVYELTVAESLAEALGSLKAQKFEAILLDLGLPDSQGIATFLEIHRRFPDLPVVVCSGDTDEEAAVGAVRIGAQDYIVKGQAAFESAVHTLRYAIERDKLQSTLRESEERHRLISGLASDYVYKGIVHADGTVETQWTSGAFERITGYSLEEINQIPHGFASLLLPEDLEDMRGQQVRFIQQGYQDSEYRIRRKDGVIRWLRDNNHISNINPQTNELEIIGAVRDITERKQAEQELRESEARARAMVNAIPDLMFRLDRTGTFLDYKAEVSQLYEQSKPIIGLRNRDIAPPEFADLIDREIEITLAAGALQTFEYQLPVPNSEVRHYEARMAPSGSNEVITIVRDVTTRKQAEEKLRESETRYRLLVETANEGIWAMDREHCTTYINQAMVALLGYEPAEILGRKVEEFFFAEDLEAHQASMQKRHAGQDEIYERCFKRQDGSPLWTLVSARALKDPQGNFNGSFAMFTDITKRKQAEEKLRESEERYRTVANFTYDWEYWADPERRIVYISPSCERITGYNPEAFLARPELVQEIIYPDDQPNARKHMEWEFSQEGTASLDYRIITANGEIRWLNHVCQSVHSSDGHWLGRRASNRDITDRKQAERQVMDLQEFLSATIDALLAHLCVLDENGVIILVNQAWRKFAEVNSPTPASDHYLGVNYLTVCDKACGKGSEDAAAMAQGIRAVMSGRLEGFQLEYPCHSPQEKRWFIARITRFTQNGAVRIAVAHENITERKQAELALQKNERVLRLFVEHSPAAIAMFDREMRYIVHSQRYLTDYRLGEQSLIGRSHYEVFPEMDEGRNEIHRRCLAGEVAKCEEDLLPRLDGTQDWVRYELRPWYEINGEIGGLIFFSEVITERKQAQAALAKSEQRLRLALETTSDGFWIVDTERRFHEVNPAYCAMSGYTRPEFLQLNISDVEVLESVEETQARIQKVQKQGGDRFETKHRRKDGSIFDVEVSVNMLDAATGQMICFCRDITERKQAEFGLRESEEKYRKLSIELEERVQRRTAEIEAVRQRLQLATQAASLGVWDWDIKTGQLYWDDQMYAIYGLPKNTFPISMETFLSIVHPEDLPNMMNSTQAALAGEPFGDIEFRIVRGDKSLGHVRVHGVIRRDTAGQAEDVIGVVQDITQEKLAEQALRASETQLRLSRDKLSAANAALEKAARMKDEFLASMSHELRTPLTGILGLSEALQFNTYGTLTEKQDKALKTIETSGRHLLALINDILDLSKIEAGMLELEIESLALTEICQASLQLTKGMAHKKRQSVTFSIAPTDIRLRGDGRRLKQMLVNLLSNAIKFTAEGGSLGLEVQGDESGQVVRLTVWDTGIGIAPENLEKLFQPFVQLESSLARQYEGSGLGLSLVHHMAELHGGSVQVESALGAGSRFTILLPWLPDTAQPSARLEKKAEALKSALIVEDSEIDAGQLARYLRILGLETVTHPVGQGAVEVAASQQPGVILLDLRLPDLHGFDVLDQLKANPITRGIPVMICSVEERRSQALAHGAAGYLVKPLAITDLRDELNRLAFDQAQGFATASEAESTKPRVLIVDDNEVIIETVSDYLTAHNFYVMAARSGMELLDVVAELHPDVILMDIQMPIMDGLEATRRIRAHPDPLVAGTPIIALTALAMMGDRERCLEAGANEYVAKPFNLSALVQIVEMLLKEAQ